MFAHKIYNAHVSGKPPKTKYYLDSNSPKLSKIFNRYFGASIRELLRKKCQKYKFCLTEQVMEFMCLNCLGNIFFILYLDRDLDFIGT